MRLRRQVMADTKRLEEKLEKAISEEDDVLKIKLQNA